MTTLAPPLPVGTVTTNTVHLADLGNVYTIGANRYRLVKSAAAITTPSGFVLTTTLTAGAPTWLVNTTTTASDPNVVGVVPAVITATIPISSFFLIQIAGPCTCISAAALALGAAVGPSTTAGKIDDASITVGVGSIGVATLVAAGADVVTNVMLRGLD